MRILIVEDEKRLANALSEILQEHNYKTDVVYDGQKGLDYAQLAAYDVIILDVMLPVMDGFTVARTLRQKHINTPILMLTARASIADKVNGLNLGADDYMTKPFSTDELLARVNALSRRQGEVIIDELKFDDISLDLSSGELYCNGNSVHLSFKELEVCRYLISNCKAIIPKDSLIVNIWGYNSDIDENNVEAYVSFLRKKLQFLNSNVTIKTYRKLGYRLEVMENDQETTT